MYAQCTELIENYSKKMLQNMNKSSIQKYYQMTGELMFVPDQ